MLNKNITENQQNNKDKKKGFQRETRQENKKRHRIDEPKTLPLNILMLLFFMKQKQRRQKKKEREKNKEPKESKKRKTRRKKERKEQQRDR